MPNLVRDVFNDICSDLLVNNELCNKLTNFVNSFISKNTDHANFFGGNLTGVYVVKFTNQDRINWFNDIIGKDEDLLTPKLNEIINPIHYAIAGDVFNLSCVWLSHVLYKSNKINEKNKKEAMVNVYNILQFRFITSRMNRHWPYPCSKEVAEATLAAMSNKFSIKRKGNWFDVIADRSKDIVDMDKSIHKLTIQRMDHDIRNSGESVGYLLTDTQGRNKEMLKNIYNLQKEVQESGIRVNNTSIISIDLDGESKLSDKNGNLEIYRNYIKSILGDKNSFIKLDLITIIENSNVTMPPIMFRQTLSYISNIYSRGDKLKIELDDVVDRLMSHLISYLSNNKNVMKNKNDISGLISKIKGVYTSSRTSDELLIGLRRDIEDIVSKATKIKNNPSVPATRTGIMLYIVLRAFAMKHYS